MAKSKYNRKYCKQLVNGLCRDGMTQEEVCQVWGIDDNTYRNWEKEYPEFARAAKVAERDRACYWHKLTRDVAQGKIKGNAGVICFALKNIKGINWQDKVEINSKSEDMIKTINLNILPAPQSPNLIGQDYDNESGS